MDLPTLNDITVSSSVSGTSHEFGIKDPRIIFTILRDKMYSNPKKAAIQEYLSNARDAHRFMGLRKVPIDLYFPSWDEDSIKIQDFGPGIQPWDIAGVFTKYGESTKRGDQKNEAGELVKAHRQTGGWGLGCKTGYAIGDSFQVVSTTPDIPYTEKHWRKDPFTGEAAPEEAYENFSPMGDDPKRLVKRVWLCYIGENQMGQADLISEKFAGPDEQRGLTIVLPVDAEDVAEYAEYAARTMQFWDVRANVYNRKLPYSDFQISFSGRGWQLLGKNSDIEEACLIVDGIQYPINYKMLENAGIPPENLGLLKRPLALFFGTGEITPTPNREDIAYDPSAIDAIAARLDQVGDHIRSYVKKQLGDIDSVENGLMFSQRFAKYRELQKQFGMEKLGIRFGDLYSTKSQIELRTFSYKKAVAGWCLQRGEKKIRHEEVMHIGEGKLFLEWNNPVASPPLRRVLNALDAHPSVHTVYIIRLERRSKEEYLASVTDGDTIIPHAVTRAMDDTQTILKKYPIIERVLQGNVLDYKKKRIAPTGKTIPKVKHCSLCDVYVRGVRRKFLEYEAFQPLDGSDGLEDRHLGGPFVVLKQQRILFPDRKPDGSFVYHHIGGYEQNTLENLLKARKTRKGYHGTNGIYGIFDRWISPSLPKKWITPKEWAIAKVKKLQKKYPFAFHGNTLRGYEDTSWPLLRCIEMRSQDIDVLTLPPGILRKWLVFRQQGALFDKVTQEFRRLCDIINLGAGDRTSYREDLVRVEKDPYIRRTFSCIKDSEFHPNRMDDLKNVLRVLHRADLARQREIKKQEKEKQELLSLVALAQATVY